MAKRTLLSNKVASLVILVAFLLPFGGMIPSAHAQTQHEATISISYDYSDPNASVVQGTSLDMNDGDSLLVHLNLTYRLPADEVPPHLNVKGGEIVDLGLEKYDDQLQLLNFDGFQYLFQLVPSQGNTIELPLTFYFNTAKYMSSDNPVNPVYRVYFTLLLSHEGQANLVLGEVLLGVIMHGLTVQSPTIPAPGSPTEVFPYATSPQEENNVWVIINGIVLAIGLILALGIIALFIVLIKTKPTLFSHFTKIFEGREKLRGEKLVRGVRKVKLDLTNKTITVIGEGLDKNIRVILIYRSGQRFENSSPATQQDGSVIVLPLEKYKGIPIAAEIITSGRIIRCENIGIYDRFNPAPVESETGPEASADTSVTGIKM